MIIPQKIHDEFILIKAAFESGAINKMSDLEKQKPSRIAKLIGMNQSRYGSKLFKPEDFTPSEIIRISLIINIDTSLIINVIKKQLLANELERISKNIIKLEREKTKKLESKK